MKLIILATFMFSASLVAQDTLFVPGGIPFTSPGIVNFGYQFDVGPTGDYNGDGLADQLFVAFEPVSLTRTIICRFADGSGGWQGESQYSVSGSCGGMGIGFFFPAQDMDGDGDLDPVIGTFCNTQILQNDGSGNFTPGSNAPASSGATPRRAHVGDVTGDGYPDLVLAWYPSGIAIWPNNFGTFGPMVQLPLNVSFNWLRVGDMDGDGDNDIVGWPDYGVQPWVVTLLRNDGLPGLPSFSLQSTVPVDTWASLSSTSPFGILLTDLDGDGCADLLGGNGNQVIQNLIRVYRGDPVLGILPAVNSVPIPPITGATFASLGASTRLFAEDMDGDGYRDLPIVGLVTSSQPGTIPDMAIGVYHGIGGGRFALPHWFLRPLIDQAPTPGDIDGDGDQDIMILIDSGPQTVTSEVYFNESIRSPGAAGTAGIPTFDHGLATFGSTSFFAGLSNARPGSVATLGVSLAPRDPSLTVPFGISIDPMDLVWPTPSFGTFLTDANGAVTLPIALPPTWSYPNESVGFFGQWAIVDPLGQVPFGGTNLALTPTRKVLIY